MEIYLKHIIDLHVDYNNPTHDICLVDSFRRVKRTIDILNEKNLNPTCIGVTSSKMKTLSAQLEIMRSVNSSSKKKAGVMIVAEAARGFMNADRDDGLGINTQALANTTPQTVKGNFNYAKLDNKPTHPK